jgi:DNA-binding NtrC family response regulator
MQHVLVVDSNPGIRGLLQMVLEDVGSYRVSTMPSNADAAAVLTRIRPKAAIVDVSGLAGLQWASQATGLGIPVLIITGEPASGRQLEEVGCPFLWKPFELDTLLRATKTIIDEGAARQRQTARLLELLVRRRANLRQAIDLTRTTVAQTRESRTKRLSRTPSP